MGVNNAKPEEFDIAIVGGGVSGTALLYTLANFSDVKRIALLEKNEVLGSVMSSHTQNSQTLHFGDIETNYSVEKSKSVKINSDMLKVFLEKSKTRHEGLFSKYSKMVIGVGMAEVEELNNRYKMIRRIFPKLSKIGREEIAKLEPNVVRGRPLDEPIIALCTEEGYTVDYGAVARAFAKDADRRGVKVYKGTRLVRIYKNGSSGFMIETNKGSFKTNVVAIAAGGYSLQFAHSLGYGRDFSVLSVSGSFYLTPKLVNGKVYTVQNPKLPFAAVHADPEVHDQSITRFGPTAKPIFMLERRNYSTVFDYFKTFGFGWRQLYTLIKLHCDAVVFRYVFRNFLYELPLIGRLLFLKDVRKIVPGAKFSQLKKAKGFGGTRPQLLNLKTKSLQLGEAKIVGEGSLFNITPSPGASICLGNAYKDAQILTSFLNEKGIKCSLDKAKFEKMYCA